MKPGRLFLLAALLGGTLFADSGEFPLSSAYIAPENQVFYRLRHGNGVYVEFQRDMDKNPDLMGNANGWVGKFQGGNIVVYGPRSAGSAFRPTWVFSNGRITWFIGSGVTNEIPYGAVRTAPAGVAPPFFYGTVQEAAAFGRKNAHKESEKILNNLLKKKWNAKERLTWPFMNPNENGFLFAGLAILAFALLLNGERPIKAMIRSGTAELTVTIVVKVVGSILFIGFCGLMFLTFSRGAFLAAFVGCTIVAAFGFRSFMDTATLIAVAVTAVMMLAGAAGIVCVRGPENMKKVLFRGFSEKSSWSNQVRYEMWDAAPTMMVDAPKGWTGGNIGRAYLDWYEQLDVLRAPGSLMNDHLTYMTRYGWPGRFGYAFSWFSVLVALAIWAVKKGNGAPFGACLALGVAAWFNPVMPNKYLWVAPLLSLLPVAVGIWRWRWKAVTLWLAVSTMVGALAAVATVWTVYVVGEGSRVEARRNRSYVPIEVTETGGVKVKNVKNPSSWVVDDGNTLGGIFTCKEIRSYYKLNDAPGSPLPGIGYARNVGQLPAKGVRRLVLAGMAGDEWLRVITKDEKARKNLPREVVFISPPFPPSAIPNGLLDASHVRYVTGEFNARFIPELSDPNSQPPSWVEIVPGMELYIMDWMRYPLGLAK